MLLQVVTLPVRKDKLEKEVREKSAELQTNSANELPPLVNGEMLIVYHLIVMLPSQWFEYFTGLLKLSWNPGACSPVINRNFFFQDIVVRFCKCITGNFWEFCLKFPKNLF